jgi:hypothetical protein
VEKWDETYFEDDTANGCTGLHGLNLGASFALSEHSLVPEAIVIVEAAHLKSVHVLQFHFD